MQSSGLRRRREFTGSLDEAAATVQWIEGVAEEQKWPDRVAFAMQVCAEELLTNIIHYGAAASPHIIVELSQAANQVRLTIEDNGQPFNIAAAEPRRIDGPLEKVEPGGLGVQLVHTFSDQLSYERRGLGNCTVAVFNLPEQPGAEPGPP